jgi:hypothetical protein
MNDLVLYRFADQLSNPKSCGLIPTLFLGFVTQDFVTDQG